MDNKIKKITAREILDSRGNPTLSVTVFAGTASGTFSVPSGASTGSHEAIEKRDHDANRFRGLGVLSCVTTAQVDIDKALHGVDVLDQKKIDGILLGLDKSEQKSNLGGNTITGVSIACAKAAAAISGKEVFEYLRTIIESGTSRETPLLFMNLMNGGKHAKTPLAFQEYHIVPQTSDVLEALVIGTTIQAELRERIAETLSPASTNLGDEGGFVPDTADVRKPLEILADVIEKSRFGGKVRISLDVAASSFYKNGAYEMNGGHMAPAELADFYKTLIRDFSIFSIEDPFYEDDFSGFAGLSGATSAVVVGDDLTVTNVLRLEEAIKSKSIGAMIVKPNQVGTLSETVAAMKLAQKNAVRCIVSHRSGETNDDFIADLAWAFGAWGLKAGAPQRGERVAKYNRLWQIQKGAGR